jgi:hypothetical protein
MKLNNEAAVFPQSEGTRLAAILKHKLLYGLTYFRVNHALVQFTTTNDVQHKKTNDVKHTCNVTTYRNTVSWQCGRDSWPRYVSKVGYAVTLLACSVGCRYLAVASKGWYGYGLSRSGHETWHVTTVRSSRLLAPVTNWEPHGVALAVTPWGTGWKFRS